jgi:hypothetical protein
VINVTSIAFIIVNCIGSVFMGFAIKALSFKGCISQGLIAFGMGFIPSKYFSTIYSIFLIVPKPMVIKIAKNRQFSQFFEATLLMYYIFSSFNKVNAFEVAFFLTSVVNTAFIINIPSSVTGFTIREHFSNKNY